MKALDGGGKIRLTGYGQEQDRQLAVAAGFDAHFTKPVDLNALQQALAKGRPGSI